MNQRLVASLSGLCLLALFCRRGVADEWCYRDSDGTIEFTSDPMLAAGFDAHKMEPACDLRSQTKPQEPDLDRYRRICTNLRPGETAQWCARYGLPTSGEVGAIQKAGTATTRPLSSDDMPTDIAVTDEDYRRICANLKPGEYVPGGCREYGFETPNSSPPTSQTGESFWRKTGRGALTVGKVAVAVPVIAVLAPLWVLSKFGEGMTKNPAATALLLQQLQANQPVPAANVLSADSPASQEPTSQTVMTCPTGSHPWVDNWGNKICKRFEDGSTATIQSNSPNGCPVGSYPWVDNWGNKICQSWGGGQRSYDTSHGCPTGSYAWVDKWGNRTCRFF